MYLARQSVSSNVKKRWRLKQSAFVPICFVLAVAFLAPTIYYMNYHRESTGCNLITVMPSGQVVHQIREYMSLYAVWKLHEEEFGKYEVRPYIMDYMKESLSDIFTGTSIPVLSSKCENIQHDIIQRFDSSYDFHVGPFRSVRYCLASYSYRYKDIIDFGVSNMRNELEFRPELVEKVEDAFETIRNSTRTKTIVCMSFRGDDYSAYLKASYKSFRGEPDYKYYIRAMDHYKRRFGNVVFVLMTIQREWLRRNRAKIATNGAIEVNPFKIRDQVLDFALLSSCNYTILNYGSFGTTAALFSGGEAIVYDMFSDEKPLESLMDGLAVAKYLPSGKWLVGNETHVGPYSDFH